jgi:hypothetical protein
VAFLGTSLIAGVFGMCLGAQSSYNGLVVIVAFIGFGVGGNIPIDSTSEYLDDCSSFSHRSLTFAIKSLSSIFQRCLSLLRWHQTVTDLCPGPILSPGSALDLPATWGRAMQPHRFRAHAKLLLFDGLGILSVDGRCCTLLFEG